MAISTAKQLRTSTWTLLPKTKVHLLSLLCVEIAVVDENDNNPEFEKKNYCQNITENRLGGAFLEQVKATDKDCRQKLSCVLNQQWTFHNWK